MKEKQDRTRYIRALERFYNTINSMLKKENFNEGLFEQGLKKAYEILQKNKPVCLYSNYTRGLELFAKECMSFKFSKNELISKSNALDKLKNAKSYKKDKHKIKFKEFF